MSLLYVNSESKKIMWIWQLKKSLKYKKKHSVPMSLVGVDDVFSWLYCVVHPVLWPLVPSRYQCETVLLPKWVHQTALTKWLVKIIKINFFFKSEMIYALMDNSISVLQSSILFNERSFIQYRLLKYINYWQFFIVR